MTLLSRIDHAAGAKSVGEELRPTRLILFGNPRMGTALMRCSQTVGIDLPMKFLIREDEESAVRIGWTEPAQLAERHAIEGCDTILERMAGALEGLARAAAGG